MSEPEEAPEWPRDTLRMGLAGFFCWVMGHNEITVPTGGDDYYVGCARCLKEVG